MIVDKLKLINFRNYDNLEISFNKNKNIIYGNNAQGKTNIIESLYFLTCGRSHRTTKDKELIKWDKEEAFIYSNIKKNVVDVKIDVKLSRNMNKSIMLNNSPIKKIGELFGNLNGVIFSPEDLNLIKEGPAERRKFLDIGISQLKPSYYYNLQQYYKSLLQRNALLKNIKYNNKLKDTISIWNNNIVEIGSKIIYYRNQYLNNIYKYAKDIHKTISNECLEIEYIPSPIIKDFNDIEKIKLLLEKEICSNIDKDINTGLTSIGPHRDNFEVLINGINSRKFASQGQQRTAVLSLKLAEVEVFKNTLNEYPILLLDDVMSELDNNRQEFLLNYLDNMQVFITCTSKDKYSDYNANYFKISNGIVSQE